MTRRGWLMPATVAVLILIGVASSVGRGVYPDSLISRIEPVRSALLEGIGIGDPLAGERAATVARIDARFGDHVLVTYVHIVLGSVFVLLAPFQFSERLRSRRPGIHRWTGRLLVATGLAATAAGLFFGVIIPAAGMAERLVVGIFGATAVGALVTAFVSIRRGDVRAHRAWMIRAFAVMLGISMIRVVALVLDLALTPLAYSPETIVVASMWAGWVLTLAGAELWLRRTARVAPPVALKRSGVLT